MNKTVNVSKQLDDIIDSEKIYSSLFKDSIPEDFKRLLLFVVWQTIKQNPGITLSKMKWKLDDQYSFNKEHVDLAVKALTNSNMFNGVSAFHIQSKNSKHEVIHLRPKEDISYLSLWEEYAVGVDSQLARLG